MSGVRTSRAWNARRLERDVPVSSFRRRLRVSGRGNAGRRGDMGVRGGRGHAVPLALQGVFYLRPCGDERREGVWGTEAAQPRVHGYLRAGRQAPACRLA